MVHPYATGSLNLDTKLIRAKYKNGVNHYSTRIKSAGHSFTPLVFSTLGQADNDALHLLYLLGRRAQQSSGDIPSRPILASSALTPANISLSRLRARLTVAAWAAGAARGSGRASIFLGSLRSFTSYTVCARDPHFLSAVFLRVCTNPL